MGDIHHDDENHADKEFNKFLNYVRTERKNNSYILGMGDYIDFQRAHDRALTRSKDAESSKLAIQEYALKSVQNLYHKIEGLNYIGLLSGNHYADIEAKVKNGSVTTIHSDAVLADMLGTTYLGVCSHVTLKLKGRKSSGEVRIIAHHGHGSAATIGGGINRVRRFLSGWDSNIALMGHSHQRGVMPTEDRISVRDGIMRSSTRWVGRTGSFLKGYEIGKQSYVTDMALNPTALGWIEFEMRLEKDGEVHIRAIQ